ncbi:MAG: response regulator [Planctomycetales bacterium]|nr:response regulator [Planctomycetales bacterium]
MIRRDTVGRPMEILLVEDSLSDARLAIESLRSGKFKCRLTLVCDGDEAMQFLRQEGPFRLAPRPDLVLLDLGLPRMDGREVLEQLRADPDLYTIPVVIQTSSATHEDMVRGEDLNVEGYMVKPLDSDKFLELVRALKRYWMNDVILPTVD